MSDQHQPPYPDIKFLRGGGQMGELIRSINWAANPLGEPHKWPVALKQAVSMMLKNNFPVLICWGPDYIQLYNDAFRPINGESKHPQAMGGSARDTYAEIWETIGPMFGEVMSGKTHGFPNFKVPLDRNGQLEDCYFDFSYSPIADIDDEILGVLVICMETTDKIRSINELRESEERFRTMAEDSDILIAIGDESSNAVYFSKAWVDLTGRLMEDLLAFGWVDLVHPEDKERYVNIYLTAFKKRVPFTGEFRVLSNNDEYRWLLAKSTPRFRPDGSFAGYISSCVDITERKNHEQHTQQLITILPASVVVIRGPELIVEMINQANLDYWNKTTAEVIGKPLVEILPELVDQPFPGQLLSVMATGEIVDVKESPVLFENKDGSIRETFVDYIYQPLTDFNGNRTGVLVMSFEITDRVTSRKLLEKYADELEETNAQLSVANSNLANSEARFKYLIQEAPVAISVLNGSEMLIESANEMILRIWGKPQSIIGQPLAIALPELEGQPFLQLLSDVYTTGKPYYGNEQRAELEQDGSLRELYFNFVYQPINDKTGITRDILIVALDVTEQVNARKSVERAEEGLRMAIEAGEMGSYYINTTDRIFHPSPRLKEFFGFRPDEEVPYEAAINQIHEDYRQQAADLVEAAITQGIRFDMEYPVVGFHDGKIRWVRGLGEVQHFGGKSYFTGVLHEITEHKHAEERQGEYTRELQTINEELAASNEELATTNEELTEIRQRLEETNQELAASASRLRMAIESTSLGTWEYNPQSGTLYWSKECRDIYGIPADEHVTMEAFIEHIHPEDSKRVDQAIHKAMDPDRGGNYDIIYRIIRFNDEETRWIKVQGTVYFDENKASRFIGTALDITEMKEADEKSAKLVAIIQSTDDAIISKTLDSIITSWNDAAERIFGYNAAEMIGESIYKLIPIDRQEEEPQILSRLRSGERVQHFETKRQTKDGRLLDVSLTISPIKDQQGNIIGLSKIARDITEKKLDETRKGDFIGMVSHELKTPLTSLNAILQVAALKLKGSQDTFLSGAMQKANQQVKRMTTMINGFLNISRLESGKIHIEKHPFNMKTLISDMIEEANITIGTHVIHFIQCPQVKVNADYNKIGSVISNFISNAVKYSPKGKNIIVSCNVKNDQVIVSVKDEGMGIKPEDIEKIFDRYYRVETNHTRHISGFGIGLYLSSEIIERHGGKVGVESETGKGSTFWFTLPLIPES